MKQAASLLLCCLLLAGCAKEPEPKDDTDDILGVWSGMPQEKLAGKANIQIDREFQITVYRAVRGDNS